MTMSWFGCFFSWFVCLVVFWWGDTWTLFISVFCVLNLQFLGYPKIQFFSENILKIVLKQHSRLLRKVRTNRPWCYDSMDSSTTNRMMMMMSASQKSSLKSLIFKLDTHQTLTKKSQPYTLRTSALLLSYKWKSSFFSFENVKCKISADKTWKKPGIFEVFLMLGLKNKRRTIFFP